MGCDSQHPCFGTVRFWMTAQRGLGPDLELFLYSIGGAAFALSKRF